MNNHIQIKSTVPIGTSELNQRSTPHRLDKTGMPQELLSTLNKKSLNKEKQGRVGFLINKKFMNNVIKFTARSYRIASVQV